MHFALIDLSSDAPKNLTCPMVTKKFLLAIDSMSPDRHIVPHDIAIHTVGCMRSVGLLPTDYPCCLGSLLDFFSLKISLSILFERVTHACRRYLSIYKIGKPLSLLIKEQFVAQLAEQGDFTGMRTTLYLRFLAPILFIGAMGYAPSLLNAQQNTSPVHTGPMPDSRFYSLSFRHILYLHNNDVQAGVVIDAHAESAGSSDSALDRYYGRRVGATVKEEGSLLAEAQSWAAEVAPVDAQAHSIIAAIRARNPGGKLAPGEQPPEPPQTLVDLQQQRDAITLKHVSNLRTVFGEARFTQLDDQARRAVHLSSHASVSAGATGRLNPMANQGRENQ